MPHLTPLRALQRAIKEVRSLYPDVPATSICVFLDIALNPGISSRDLMKNAGVSQSAVSRHMAILGPYNWRGGEGLQLIESIEDPEDRRQKISFLTPKGRTLAIKLFELIEPNAAPPAHADFPDSLNYVKGIRGAR